MIDYSYYFTHYGGLFIDAAFMLICYFGGLLAKRIIKMTDEFLKILYTAISLSCILVGISGVHVNNPIVCVVALLTGPIIGYFTHLSSHITHLVDSVATGIFRCSDADKFRDPFIAYLMLTLIGTLSINGPIANVLNGDMSLMLIKASLDGLTAFIFALTYEDSRSLLVAIPIVITAVLAVYFVTAFFSSSDFLTRAVTDTSTVGSVLMILLGLNILKVTNIDSITLLPAIIIPIILSI